MSNASLCDPFAAYGFPYQFSCSGNTGPYNPNINLTDTLDKYVNQTGQASQDALETCCPSAVVPISDDTFKTRCFSYCNTTSLEEALEASYCLGNYTLKHPKDFLVNLGCDIKGATDDSGAATLGRTGGWGGLVILGLVVSAAATMM